MNIQPRELVDVDYNQPPIFPERGEVVYYDPIDKMVIIGDKDILGVRSLIAAILNSHSEDYWKDPEGALNAAYSKVLRQVQGDIKDGHQDDIDIDYLTGVSLIATKGVLEGVLDLLSDMFNLEISVTMNDEDRVTSREIEGITKSLSIVLLLGETGDLFFLEAVDHGYYYEVIEDISP